MTKICGITFSWMIRTHLPDVMQIDAASECSWYERWTESEFLACMRGRANIGVVAEKDHRIVGFMLYSIDRTNYHIFKIAVDQNRLRRGVGTEIVQRLIGKLAVQKRDTITCDVPERNVPCQLFLQSCGFRSEYVKRGTCRGNDLYVMRYTEKKTVEHPWAPHNRISGLFKD